MKTGEEKKYLKVGKVVGCVDWLMRKCLLLGFMMLGAYFFFFFDFVLLSNRHLTPPSLQQLVTRMVSELLLCLLVIWYLQERIKHWYVGIGELGVRL